MTRPVFEVARGQRRGGHAAVLSLAMILATASCATSSKPPVGAVEAAGVVRDRIAEAEKNIPGLAEAKPNNKFSIEPCGDSPSPTSGELYALQMDDVVSPIRLPQRVLAKNFESYWAHRGWHVIYRIDDSDELSISMGDDDGYGMMIIIIENRAFISGTTPCVADSERVVPN